MKKLNIDYCANDFYKDPYPEDIERINRTLKKVANDEKLRAQGYVNISIRSRKALNQLMQKGFIVVKTIPVDPKNMYQVRWK